MIKNMACDKEELCAKVNALIKDGLQINDIEVSSAEEKDSFAEGIEGVIIVKFVSEDECKTVLKRKATLRGKDSYNKVYIELERTRQKRDNLFNLRLQNKTDNQYLQLNL